MITLIPFIPQWLRRWRPKPVPPKSKIITKKDRQVLPTLPETTRPPKSWQEDTSPAGFRIQWRF